MTDEQLLEWAKQAGAVEERVGQGSAYSEWQMSQRHWRRFAELVSQAEREACAQECDAHAMEPRIMIVTRITDSTRTVVSQECAALIRMRR